jgi:hypothetical protein
LSNLFSPPKAFRIISKKKTPYRWNPEVAAMGSLSNDELEYVYKNGMKPSQYLAYK